MPLTELQLAVRDSIRQAEKAHQLALMDLEVSSRAYRDVCNELFALKDQIIALADSWEARPIIGKRVARSIRALAPDWPPDNRPTADEVDRSDDD